MRQSLYFLIMICAALSAFAGDLPLERPLPAFPIGEDNPVQDPIELEFYTPEMDGYQDYGLTGACDRIIETMCVCECGGMSLPYPLPPCPDPSSPYGNIFAPAGLGLLAAYPVTGVPDHLVASLDFGEFGLCYSYSGGEYKFGSSTPYFLYYLTEIIPSAVGYRNHAETEFFVALENGTYGENNWDTAGFLNYIATTRDGNYINQRCYEMSSLLKASYLMGSEAQFEEFGCWTKQTAIDSLNPSVYYPVMGSASAVFALASSQLDYDPQGGIWAAETSISGIMNQLLNYQHPTEGGFVWSTLLSTPYQVTDQDIQTTAFAILAMKALDPWLYAAEITAAENFLWNIQLANGGFPWYPGGTEIVQVDGEVLWALEYEPEPWRDGDVDGNKVLSAQDSQMAFEIYLGYITPTWRQNSAADCNGSGHITAADAQCIWRSFLYGDCSCVNDIIVNHTCP